MSPGVPSGLPQNHSSPDLRLGSVLNQTYRLERVLGVGGMGTVYAAQHVLLQQPVAIKILHQRMGDRSISLERFRREAQIAAQLGHPGLVSVLDFNLTEDGAPYMVMEYLGGQTLQERLAKGALGLPDTCAIFDQLCDALHAVHEAGVVHRDLKPENIILLRTDPAGRPLSPGEPPRVKLLDFGVSKILSDAQGIDQGGAEAGPGGAGQGGAGQAHRNDHEIVGTPSYLAPEQAAGRGFVVDRRADLFALGTILYECLTGQRAFDGPHALAVLRVMMTEPVPSLAKRLLELALPEDVLVALDGVVARACAKDPVLRYATALEFLQALRAAVPGASAATVTLLSGPQEMDWSDGDTMYDAQADSLQRAVAEYEGSAVETVPQGLRPSAALAAALAQQPARAENEMTLADDSQRLSATAASILPAGLPAGAAHQPAGRGASTFGTERPTTILDTIGTPPQGSAAPPYGRAAVPAPPVRDVLTGVTHPMVTEISRRSSVGPTVVTALLAVLVGIVVGMLLLKLMSRDAGPSLALERTQQLEQLLGEGEELAQKSRCDEAIQRASAVLLIDRQNARAREIQRRCAQR